tara:strand:+ start:8760 stop:9641 length:882 start_codon:yes stop_codon:yes gene_type:complete
MMSVYVWTDIDLDGAGAYTVMTWLYGSKLPFTASSVSRVGSEFESWYAIKGSNYDHIYVLDLDVSQHIEIFDKPNVIVIDHHALHVDNKHKYKNAKVILSKYPSATKLLYSTFKDKLKLNKFQKYLIALVDDYDSYTLNFPESKPMNHWFWELTGNRVAIFNEKYSNGFRGFDKMQLHVIEMFNRKVKRLVKTADRFYGKVQFEGKLYSILGTDVTSAINEVLHQMITEEGVDFAFTFNSATKSISFRRADDCDIELHKFAEKLCKGGGHSAAAGGKSTDRFIEFTKTLKNTQ